MQSAAARPSASYNILNPLKASVVVIGAGAIGASTAAQLAQLGCPVLVLEKELQPALHQSGRNSGVIHAGYNLRPGTLKAIFCVEGSRRLRAFCRERGVPMEQRGILVIARTEDERLTLQELERRSKGNGVIAQIVEGSEIPRIEPHVQGVQALYAPEGASFDSAAYVRMLLDDAARAGGRVLYGVRVLEVNDRSQEGPTHAPVVLRTSAGRFDCDVVVNCAGLHADRLAGTLAHDVRVIPFRGYYAELKEHARPLVASHVYPVPDLALPFLGIHLSRRVDGRVIVGPGAMLAFGREAYRFREFNLTDLWATLTWPGFYRLAGRPRFLELLCDEVAKSLFLKRIWAEARTFVPQLEPKNLQRSYAGNRAQLVTKRGDLVEDIVIRETPRAIHVLNAVSPGLTCSLPFGEEIAKRAYAKLENRSIRAFWDQETEPGNPRLLDGR